MIEGIAEYCEFKFSSYINVINKNLYYSKRNSENEYIKNIVKIYDEYMNKNNLDFNIVEFIEVLVFYDLKTLGDKAWDDEQFSNYHVPALLTNYLIEQHGIGTYMTVFKDFTSFYTYYNESYPNMLNKFIDYLYEKYKPYFD